MPKTEVYSWRLSPRHKAALEAAARREEKSLAQLLDEITRQWLARDRDREGGDERQRQLREAAMEFVGSLHGGRPDRAECARRDLRSSLARKHGRPP